MTHNPHPITSTEYRILNVIREHYDETDGLLISHDIRHVANDEVYLAYIVVTYESDASYIIHTETVRVDIGPLSNAYTMSFTLLTEYDLDLTSAVK
jgi:hypothetical protein